MDWKEYDIAYNLHRTRQRYLVYKKAYGDENTTDARMAVSHTLAQYEYWCNKAETILGMKRYLELIRKPLPLMPL